jgi:hypothetical protein
MKTVLTASLLALMVSAAHLPVNAHHSIAAQFHLDKKNTVVGTITKMEFKNPHSWLYVEGKDASGEVAAWSIEFGSANALYRRGWRREDLPVGAAVTVTGYVARDGSRILGATDVKLADGRTLFAGSAPGR